MRVLSDEELKKWKTMFADEGIVYEHDVEYHEAIDNLLGYFELLIEMDAKQKIDTSADSAA